MRGCHDRTCRLQRTALLTEWHYGKGSPNQPDARDTFKPHVIRNVNAAIELYSSTAQSCEHCLTVAPVVA
jgi:hypothetical protein